VKKFQLGQSIKGDINIFINSHPMETNNSANIEAVNTLIAIQEKLIGTNELNNSAGLLNHNLDLERKVLQILK